jgi:2'-5' RNA ligase
MFFAIWPTPEVATQLAARLPVRVPPHRAIAAGDLHLTLLFLGSITPSQLEAARAAAIAQLGAPFEIRLDRIGQFAGAQVLWMGPSVVPQPLRLLAANLKAALREAIPLREEREYRPHLTLARKTFLVPPPERNCEPVVWPVRNFVLAESRPERARNEPRYAIVERWPLCG